jgi:protein-S-isoprenylcysteine O-methyltransferase Ste14
MVLRHLLAILLLPFMVVVVVPYTLVGGSADHLDTSPSSPIELFRLVLGAALFGCGLALFGWCVTLFARFGRGTLAPWDPTRNLVAVGPYRYVRNPMITAVSLMLVGEAVLWASRPLAIWALSFLLFNHLYFMLVEEPGLERRFGESYRTYKARVPRWIPRLLSTGRKVDDW